jgi:hypothetical protein
MNHEREKCDCPTCSWFQVRREHPDMLPLFVVYDHPADFPDFIVLRLWLTDKPTSRAWTFENVELARSVIPGGLTRLPRSVEDDANILETWL